MLPAGYSIREMDDKDFQPLWREHSAKVFDDNAPIFHVYPSLSEAEQARWKDLGQRMGKPWQLRLGVFAGEEFVGWHTGNQENASTFYMRNSAILPAHRRKGLYRALLAETLKRCQEQGFQEIYSRHVATNNDVIIPKLQAGFLITGMEVSPAFGTLVHLSYFPNPLVRKMAIYRAGDCYPDAEIREKLGLS